MQVKNVRKGKKQESEAKQETAQIYRNLVVKLQTRKKA